MDKTIIQIIKLTSFASMIYIIVADSLIFPHILIS